MVLIELGGTARDTFLLFNAQGDLANAVPTSPVEPRVTSVTLNNAPADGLIVPAIQQATAGSPEVALTGQYEAEFTADYAGVAPGDVIVVRITATINPGMKVKENVLKFMVNPSAPAEPFIDVT